MNKQQIEAVIVDLVPKHIQPNGTIAWSLLYKEFKQRVPESPLSCEGVRSIYRRFANSPTDNITANNLKYTDEEYGRVNIIDRILQRIKKRQELTNLAYKLSMTVDDLLVTLARMQLNGYSGIKLWSEGGTQYVQNVVKSLDYANQVDLRSISDGYDEVTIAVIGDTHYGSEYAAEQELHDFYNICVKRGIKDVFHVGDIAEGIKANRIETFLGNRALGFQEQLEYIVKNYPKRTGITTHFILGNHDLFFQQGNLANLGRTLSLIRPDLHYMGDEFAIAWLSQEVSLALIHPNDGSSSNVFHKVQNYIDRVSPEKLATINAIGHYHKMGLIKHRDVFGLYTASFQFPSPWMSNKNLKSYVGGWILTLKLDKETGKLLSLVPEYIDYHRS